MHARADRVDILASGEIAIADIKTGSAPSKKEIQTGKAAQLPLEAAIARYGEFSSLGSLRTKALSIWRLGGRDGGNIVEIQDSAVNEALENVWTGVARLISSFDDPNTPYLSEPRRPVRYSDYRVLARRRIDLGDET
jgi:ATP-dependent helicase/nuclease subunit B